MVKKPSVMEQITCGACGAPVAMDNKKCPFCDSHFVPEEEPVPVIIEPVKELPPKRYDLLKKGQAFIEDMRQGEIGYVSPTYFAKDIFGINKRHIFTRRPEYKGFFVKIKMDHGTVLVEQGKYPHPLLRVNYPPEYLLPVKIVKSFSIFNRTPAYI